MKLQHRPQAPPGPGADPPRQGGLASTINRWGPTLVLLSLLGVVVSPPSAWSEATPQPLLQAHAHNDYEHARPLLDALDHGFMGVEADVWVVDGKLLVAHDRGGVKPDRTLESLYLAPLAERVKQNGGKVHPGAGALMLLIDLKSPAGETWAVLHPVLERYRAMLTECVQGAVQERAVTVILSGNRPVAELTAEPRRVAFIDGRPEDLDRNPPVSLVPLVSAAWSSLFTWRGEGVCPLDQREKLLSLTARAHGQGRRVRFWGTRDDAATWDVLLAARVDHLNVDDLAKVRDYLKQAKVTATPLKTP